QALQKSRAPWGVDRQTEFRSLVKEAQQHVWVQYEREGKWVDLDPSFGAARVGEPPARTPTLYPKLPHELYHTVTFRVKVEQQDSRKKLQVRTLLETTHAA